MQFIYVQKYKISTYISIKFLLFLEIPEASLTLIYFIELFCPYLIPQWD